MKAWQAFDFKRFIDITLILALFTAVTTVVSIIFQQSYLGEYGISPSTYTVRIDPVAILNASIILILSLLGMLLIYAETALFRVLDRHPLWRFIFMDATSLLVILTAAMGLIAQPEWKILDVFVFKFEQRGMWLAFLCFFAAYLILRSILISRHIARKKQGFIAAYRVLADKDGTGGKDRKRWIFSYTTTSLLLVIVGIIFIVVIPAQAAKEIAQNEKKYPTITTLSNRLVETVVVGTVNEGLVVKKYNPQTNKFEEGYQIIENKNLSFGTITIQK